MSAEFAIDLVRRGVLLGLLVAGPMLATALVVGFFVSLVQAVTQIQEQTLTFIPKLLMIAVIFALSLPWIITQLVEFVIGIMNNLGMMGG
jgi:flagellar biosynthetic protein FliQ